jgi:hypothetical protein
MWLNVIVEPVIKVIDTVGITSLLEVELQISIKTVDTESLLGSKREGKRLEWVSVNFVE